MKQQNQQSSDGINTIKKLILHFDINKTIVLQDTENGMNKEQTVSNLINNVNMAWGKIDEKNPNQWKAMHPVFIKIQPQPGLITYREFIEQLYEFKSQEDEPDPIEREKYNEEQQEARQESFNNFVKVAGSKLKTEIDKITKHLVYQNKLSLKLLINSHQIRLFWRNLNFLEIRNKQNIFFPFESLFKIGGDENPLIQNFYDGKSFIMPNFFRMMISLKKQKKEFAVVFRAFGPELNQVVTEFNKFCAGEHPCYNGKNNFPIARFDGSKGSKNFIIAPENQITLYRFNNELQGMQGVFGTLKRYPVNRELSEINIEEYYEKEIDDVGAHIEKEGGNIQLCMMQQLSKSCGIAISEDHEYHLQNYKAPESGKQLLIDQTDYSTLQIFFDDEINEQLQLFQNYFVSREEGSVVFVKDYVTNLIIPIKKSLNKLNFIFYNIGGQALIRDPDYFIKAIDACEKARQEEIEKIEKGISDDIPIVPKKSEWELLNELNDGDYLRKTVLPLLYPALSLVDIERPTDPISFISLYMLKNKDKVQLPLPPQAADQSKEEDQQKLKQQENEQEINEQQQQQQK